MARNRPRSRLRRAEIPEKAIPLAGTTGEETLRGGTSGPDDVARRDRGTGFDTPDDEPVDIPPETTWPALVARLMGGFRLTFWHLILLVLVGWIGALPWIFIQDNAAGRLEVGAGYLALLAKYGFWTAVAVLLVTTFAILGLVSSIVQGVRRLFSRRRFPKSLR